MRIKKIAINVVLLFVLCLLSGACNEQTEVDPCLKTKWPQTKEYEIKLAVQVLNSNPLLSGGAPGSQAPADFRNMIVNGTIEKVECNNEKTSSPVSIGNSYITKGVDIPASIYVSDAWWIGHVVYVYEFGNDKDHLNIELTVKITMADNQSYMCNVSRQIYYQQIEQMAGDFFYFILLDVYSDNWIKI